MIKMMQMMTLMLTEEAEVVQAATGPPPAHILRKCKIRYVEAT